MSSRGRVAVFGPNPMLSITIEALTAEGGDDIHLHAAGQGVWVARMAAELEVQADLCGFIGGETGAVLRPLLEQHPAAAAEGHLRQLPLAQARDRRCRDLAAGEDRYRDPLLAQPPIDGIDPLGDLVDADVVVVANMRGRADRLDPVASRLAGHSRAVADVERPIVDAGQDVAVQIDQGSQDAKPRSADSARRQRATMTGMIQHLPPLGLRRWIGLQRE